MHAQRHYAFKLMQQLLSGHLCRPMCKMQRASNATNTQHFDASYRLSKTKLAKDSQSIHQRQVRPENSWTGKSVVNNTDEAFLLAESSHCWYVWDL